MAAEKASHISEEQVTLTDFGRDLGGAFGQINNSLRLQFPLYHDQHRVHYYGSNPPPVYINGKGELIRRHVDTKPPASRR